MISKIEIVKMTKIGQFGIMAKLNLYPHLPSRHFLTIFVNINVVINSPPSHPYGQAVIPTKWTNDEIWLGLHLILTPHCTILTPFQREESFPFHVGINYRLLTLCFEISTSISLLGLLWAGFFIGKDYGLWLQRRSLNKFYLSFECNYSKWRRWWDLIVS